MSNRSTVTVLMPVFNAERFLRQAIESILRQSHGDFEFLVVDDNSTDGSRAIVDSYQDSRIRVAFNSGRRGVAESLNRGLSMAAGELICRMDADDIAEVDRLEIQLDAFKSRPELDVVGSNVLLIDENGTEIGQWDYPEDDRGIKRQLEMSCCIAHPSVVYRRSLILSAGGYDSRFPNEDYDLWFRLRKGATFHNVQQALLRYRVHESNASVFDIERFVIAHMCVQNGMRSAPPSRRELMRIGISEKSINNRLAQSALFWIETYEKAGRPDLASKIAHSIDVGGWRSSSPRLRLALARKGRSRRPG